MKISPSASSTIRFPSRCRSTIALTLDGGRWRSDRSEQKGGRQSNVPHNMPDDPAAQRVEIQQDVWELRHRHCYRLIR